MLFTETLSQLWQLLDTLQTPLRMDPAPLEFPTFAFGEQFAVLGPFQIGTREAAWDSDPLELLGGFPSLKYDPNATVRSSLASNGTVTWSSHTGRVARPDSQRASVELNVSFPDIDWRGLRDIYGWAALQWQAWARGEIIVQSESVEVLALHTPGILEYYVDDVHYFGGDFYSFQRAPVTLHLAPGIHRIDVRLVRDVRAMGGVGEPSINLNLILQKSSTTLRPALETEKVPLISDFIGSAKNYTLASPFGSLLVRNDGEVDLVITSIHAPPEKCLAELLGEVRLVPGQSRPVAFRLDCLAGSGRRIPLRLRYTIEGDDQTHTYAFTATSELRDVREPHKVTFLHPAGVVSYAVLRPPSRKAESSVSANASLPVFMALHGAGLEADNDAMRLSFEALPDLAAWTLFPTGGTSWSGDDWHAWGFLDVEAAVEMIPAWIERHGWKGAAVNVDRWVVAGHSNGGQGAWYTLLHRPDKVFAAAPLSGYSSIQNYVPYSFWHPADPARTAIVQAALGSYRHELLLPNAAGIPVFQQHGGADDNVPVYHSRQMAQLIREAGADSQYHEIEGMPHWWDGIFTTESLRAFYQEQVARATVDASEPSLDITNFSLVVINPGDTGFKHGFGILQLAVPGRYGRIDVEFDALTRSCSIRTSNVKMVHLSSAVTSCSQIRVDGQDVNVRSTDPTTGTAITRDDADEWHMTEDHANENLTRPVLAPRHGRQLASMDAILRTHGPFQIVVHSLSPATSRIALQISRNLCQYLAADAIITSSHPAALTAPGNIISIAVGDTLAPSPSHPISIHNGSTIHVRRSAGTTKKFSPRSEPLHAGLGAVFLRPLPQGRLELVVWAAEETSLDLAARLVPLLPGSGQPDFVVVDGSARWRGLEGARALGFFGHDWQVSSESSFFS